MAESANSLDIYKKYAILDPMEMATWQKRVIAALLDLPGTDDPNGLADMLRALRSSGELEHGPKPGESPEEFARAAWMRRFWPDGLTETAMRAKSWWPEEDFQFWFAVEQQIVWMSPGRSETTRAFVRGEVGERVLTGIRRTRPDGIANSPVLLADAFLTCSRA